MQPLPDYTSPLPERPKRNHRRWVIPTAVGIVAFIVGISIGATGSSTQSAGATPTVTVTDTSVEQGPTYTETVTATPTADSQGLATVISQDGVYVVGSDIPGGTWHTSGGADCYEATMSGLDTTNVDQIISNNNFSGPSTVNLSGVKAFNITGGCTWKHRG